MIKFFSILFLLIPLTVLSSTSSQKKQIQFFLKIVDELNNPHPLRASHATPDKSKKKEKKFLSYRAWIGALVQDHIDNPDDPMNSVESYRRNYRRAEGFPAHPEEAYAEYWTTWGDVWKEIEKALRAINKTAKEPTPTMAKDSESKESVSQKKESMTPTPQKLAQTTEKDSDLKESVSLKEEFMIPTPQKLLQVLVTHNIKHPNQQINSPESYEEYFKLVKGAPPSPHIYYGSAWPGNEEFFKQLNNQCEKIFRETSEK